MAQLGNLNIRNFAILAHIDHGKSTLADRFLELTGTVEKRKMQDQMLDTMSIERERGITIKMQPVRMVYHSNCGLTQNNTQNNAEMSANADRGLTQKDAEFLYRDITYKIRGAAFEIRKKIGLGHKEQIYHNALEIEFERLGLNFESKKNIPIVYERKNIGTYQPDFIVDDKVLIELKSLPEIGNSQTEQLWSYLKGCDFKLALLINFGNKDLEIKRVVYDTARFPRNSASSPRESAGVSHQIENVFILNLIDTPGHVDFGYEVSRSLAAVEGAILLVDCTKGVQAQTLANLEQAQKQNLVIIPAVNKIDLPNARSEETKKEVAELLGISESEILAISGKTGHGVKELLEKIVRDIPPPKGDASAPLKALIFDSSYDAYKGVIAHVRLTAGIAGKANKIKFMISGAGAEILELGIFKPHLEERQTLQSGEIGYIATGLKDIAQVRVGDTITLAANPAQSPLLGYRDPQRVVFASFFSEEEEFDGLRNALGKLKLNDASFYFEPEQSDAFGRGFRCGFLGMLHMDIIRERLQREYGIEPVITTPSVSYKIKPRDKEEVVIYSPSQINETMQIDVISEPYARIEVLADSQYLGGVMKLLEEARGNYKETKYLTPEKALLIYEAPLAEIIVDFYDQLKSATSGYASLNYEVIGWRENDLVKMDVLVAGDKVEALSQIVPRQLAEKRGRALVERLKDIIPRQLFAVAVQAAIGGKIIARTDIAAMRKDVTGYLYGGDYSRKKKLLEKQKKGKKKMKAMGKVDIPSEVYFKVLKK